MEGSIHFSAPMGVRPQRDARPFEFLNDLELDLAKRGLEMSLCADGDDKLSEFAQHETRRMIAEIGIEKAKREAERVKDRRDIEQALTRIVPGFMMGD